MAGRASRGTRTKKETAGYVAQGKVTEPDYLSRLSKEYRVPLTRITKEAGLNPSRLVEKARNAAKDREFDYVFILIDKDDSTEADIKKAIKLCNTYSKRKKNRIKTNYQLILTSECFEAWMYAHQQKCSTTFTRTDLKKKLEKLGWVGGKKAKHICDTFPIQDHQKARGNIKIIAPNTYAEAPCTAVPHLVDFAVRNQQ